jgi:iron complex outermembrane receptor protein
LLGSSLDPRAICTAVVLWTIPLLCAALAMPAWSAAESPAGGARELAEMSLEELMNEPVTSVSKKEQKLSQVAAAIFVINQEDIRRSGALNIPDLLRMVPGLDVAQINANTWAISARGFNHQFSDKLLVLIDGRAVYQSTSGGVNWDTQDVPLEDIERIEVIRGPGATVWGANAMNGVINVITLKAQDTQGALVTAGGGTQDRAFGTARYGGTLGEELSYRVFTKYLDRNNLSDLTGQEANDGGHLLHGGFRMDGNLTPKDSLTVQGDLYSGREGDIIGHIASIPASDNENVQRNVDLSGGNILGRWNHVISSRVDTTTQVYFDRYLRSGPESIEDRNTFDIDYQQHLVVGSRQDLVWGAGYRHSADRIVPTIDQAYVPAARTLQLFSAFVQDEITLKTDRAFLTVGTKLEHDDYTGFEVEPSLRLSITPTARTTVWAAVSEAVRTPTRVDADGEFNIAAFPLSDGSPAVLTITGNPQQKSEHLLATELGYRVQASDRLSIDLSTFYNQYRDLRSLEPGAPFLVTDPVPHIEIPLVYANLLHGTTDGVEVSAHWKVTDRWTLSPGLALLHMNLRTDPTSLDTTTVADLEGSNPRHQAQLRSSLNLPRGFSWDTSVYFVDHLPAPQLPSYTRLDTRFSWRPAERAELSLVGQNLLQDHHVESNDTGTSVNSTQVRRSAYVKFSWRF